MLKTLTFTLFPIMLMLTACDRQESFGEELREATKADKEAVGEQLTDVVQSIGNQRSELDKRTDHTIRETEKWLTARSEDMSDSTQSVRDKLDELSATIQELPDQADDTYEQTAARVEELMASLKDEVGADN